MPWDLKIDPGSGDLVFGGNQDLMGVSGTELINQRIRTRCRIPRGSFKGGDDDTLGSDLYLLSGRQAELQISEAEAAVRDALEPMTEIQVVAVTVSVTDANQLLIQVAWSPLVSPNEPAGELVEPAPIFSTSFEATA